MTRAKAARTEKEWNAFVRSFRAEMNEATPRRALDLLATLPVARTWKPASSRDDPGRSKSLRSNSIWVGVAAPLHSASTWSTVNSLVGNFRLRRTKR